MAISLENKELSVLELAEKIKGQLDAGFVLHNYAHELDLIQEISRRALLLEAAGIPRSSLIEGGVKFYGPVHELDHRVVKLTLGVEGGQLVGNPEDVLFTMPIDLVRSKKHTTIVSKMSWKYALGEATREELAHEISKAFSRSIVTFTKSLFKTDITRNIKRVLEGEISISLLDKVQVKEHVLNDAYRYLRNDFMRLKRSVPYYKELVTSYIRSSQELSNLLSIAAVYGDIRDYVDEDYLDELDEEFVAAILRSIQLDVNKDSLWLYSVDEAINTAQKVCPDKLTPFKDEIYLALKALSNRVIANDEALYTITADTYTGYQGKTSDTIHSSSNSVTLIDQFTPNPIFRRNYRMSDLDERSSMVGPGSKLYILNDEDLMGFCIEPTRVHEDLFGRHTGSQTFGYRETPEYLAARLADIASYVTEHIAQADYNYEVIIDFHSLVECDLSPVFDQVNRLFDLIKLSWGMINGTECDVERLMAIRDRAISSAKVNVHDPINDGTFTKTYPMAESI